MIKTIKKNIEIAILKLSTINVELVIERIFRYFEMIIVSSLIIVVIGVFSDPISRFFTALLAVLTGMYIAIPISNWISRDVTEISGIETIRRILFIVIFGIQSAIF